MRFFSHLILEIKETEMNYWLVKSEPSTYSIDDLKKEKQTFWSGVRNYTARNNLKAMAKGDICIFYHSVKDPAIVGLCKVVKEHYQDPTTDETAWVVVDVAFLEKFKKEIPLGEVKNHPKLANMELLRQSRLSVQKVTQEEFDYIILLANGK
jgi:predicted RNA-binding protein with PUA-like domain